jgi:TIR domain
MEGAVAGPASTAGQPAWPPAGAESPRYDAFISYAHVDRAFAVALRDALQAKGLTVWVDESPLHGDSRWSEAQVRAAGPG